MTTRRLVRIAPPLVILLVLFSGMCIRQAANGSGCLPETYARPDNLQLSPSFNGAMYSSDLPPRFMQEYLFGGKSATSQNIPAGGTSALDFDIPASWAPIDVFAAISKLSANQSLLRNSNFLSGHMEGARSVVDSWTNKTSRNTFVRAEWNNGTPAKDVYTVALAGQTCETYDYGRWSQTIYVNGSNPTRAVLDFKIWKAGSPGTPAINRIYAYAYINQIQVFNSRFADINTTSYEIARDVSSVVTTLPATVNVTLKMGFTNTATPSENAYIYFDDVYLYINSTVVPKNVDLKLNGSSVLGQRYGNGTVHLRGSLSPPFLFSSNSTGSVKFRCDSTIEVYRSGSSGLVSYNVTQSSPAINYNVSKSPVFNSSSWTYGTTLYTADVLNSSIPRDWTYDRVVCPDGTVIQGESQGRVRRWDNNSYNWVITVNASNIGSYGPKPYIVVAQATNYLGPVSTYASSASGWVARSLFTNGSRIKINSTVQQGSASKGSAHVIFYNASNYSVWKNMTEYAVSPDAGGVVTFDFLWSTYNVTKSGLVTLVAWSNSSEVGVKWVPISFDLVPPQTSVTSPSAGQCVKGITDVAVSNIDANPYNMTLYISGTVVETWTSTSAIYSWNTTKYPDGGIELKVRGRDQVDHVNTTTCQVTVDNTLPGLTTNLPANYSYVRQTVTLTAAITDANPKNVTIYVDGVPSSSAPSGSTTSYWNTRTHVDGLVELEAVSWDKAGGSNRTKAFVYVDNTVPVFRVSLPSVDQYVAGNITVDVLCTDTSFKNVSLLIGGIEVGSWIYEHPSYRWNTTTRVDGSYALVVRGWDLAGNENETLMMNVYVDNTPPSVPSLVYPNNLDVFNSTTLGRPLSWSASSDLGSGLDHYVLQLDSSPYFNSANLRTIPLSVTSYSIPADIPLSNGTWYWRVRAVDRLGNIGGYSETRSFQVVEGLPPPEGLPLPLIIGFAGAIPAAVILSSIILLKRRKAEPETYEASNLLAAYVFSSDGRAMFTHQFKGVKVEPQLMSGFLTAISEMMKEVVGGDRRPLSTIERSDAKIIIERGTVVSGALVSKEASREYRRRLRAFLNRFEDDYGEEIVAWKGDVAVFQAAYEVIEEVFSQKAKATTYPTITGLEDLLFSDRLGGVAVSVEGRTGSGKTAFCLRYASSLLKRGKTVIIIAASLPPKDVRETLRKNDIDSAEAEKARNLMIYDAFSEISGIQSEEKFKFGSPGELNNMNIALSRSLSGLRNATIFFDSLSTMVHYSELELVADFVRTIKAKISEGGHTAFFVVDSNVHDRDQLNYISSVMDGEIEIVSQTTKEGEPERLVSFKRLKDFRIRPGYHEFK